MKTFIDVENWNRKEHFQFFKTFDEPYFSVTTDIDITNLYQYSKENKLSLFACYMFAILRVANEIPEFRYRIEGDRVWYYQTIHVSPTIARVDHTFGFSFIPYENDLHSFCKNTNDAISILNNTQGLCLSEETARQDVIHFSAIPWIKFTSLSHATNFGNSTGIPKISVGKFFDHNGTKKIPISISVHHALIDGFHVGLFIDKLEKLRF